ncbi:MULTISPECIES: GNAT family N-acetyltransferase [Nonomuraea]|uniref:GNAT family N-acetyltransferase n=1 Tax=Nonomuraea mangrovi TaxID=2316207 RepID=A0ABW4SSP4_9ACTN
MWTFSPDAAEFAAHAEAFLGTDPAANTVPLTVLAGLRDGMPGDDASFGWWSEDGEVKGAVFRTPPRPFYLAPMPIAAVRPLVDELRVRGVGTPEISGPVDVVDAFIAAAGATPSRRRPERLYRLGTLEAPAVAGKGRRATMGDFPLVMNWFDAFATEVGLHGDGDTAELAQRRIARGDIILWVDGDVPVALAGISPEAAGMCRIGPVYTPPSSRRRGYGAAVTAYASRLALAERCTMTVLFTDLNNPTSNAIYQSIGYQPVSDYAHVVLEPVP